MTYKLLIDECLSPSLVAMAKARGIAADAVVHLGKQGWQDHNLVPFAVENDYVIVTNNRRDFLKQYLKLDLHGGLIVLVPLVARKLQSELFELALDRMAELNEDLVNHIIEVLEDGSVHVRNWSAGEHDLGHITNPTWPKSRGS